MHKKIVMLFLFGLLVICTSCFEIIEEVSFNEDGSGSVTLTINLSKSRTKINSIMLLDSINNYKVPTKTTINNKIATVIQKIKQIKGVSNVKNTSNYDEYIFTVSCNFTNVEVLNTVIASLSTKNNEAKIKQQQFSFNKLENSFTREHQYNLSKEFSKTKMEDRKVFETATITTIYRFKTPIVSSKNPDAKISGDKKAIMLRLNAQELIKNTKSIKNKIQLQK